MKTKSSLLIAFLCFLFLFSCDKKRVFDEYKNVGNAWHKDSIVTFDLPQLDAKKKYNGAIGTAVVKVFDKTLGATGLTEKFLRQSGSDVGVSFVHSNNHAGYFPGAERLALKLVYDRKTGKLLGAQCFGGDGADKRIDTAATALASGMTVEAMAELDLAYAPPFSSANDPINFAAFQAVNQMEGSVNIISASELDSLKDYFFLDVRNPDEISRYKVITNLLHQMRAVFT